MGQYAQEHFLHVQTNFAQQLLVAALLNKRFGYTDIEHLCLAKSVGEEKLIDLRSQASFKECSSMVTMRLWVKSK